MGGKKKTLANRLAKMSDGDRARYLQRKADMEEEAKRRKEQLVSTFMKNKIKREDAFSRLNLAKINQHWHQILRTAKCKSMREDVEHMKQFIARSVEYKNRTINLLLEELDMAEMQYGHNFQVHSLHIDHMIESHNEHLQRIEQQYLQDRDELISTMEQEQEELEGKVDIEQTYLKTLIFAEASKASKKSMKAQDRYMEKKQDLISTYQMKLSGLVKKHNGLSAGIWRQIAEIVRSHVNRTDARRLHLAELKRVDAESATKIAMDQEHINKLENQIVSLKSHLTSLKEKHMKKSEHLKQKLQDDKKTFQQMRTQFRKETSIDEKKLTFLSEISHGTHEYLDEIHVKGMKLIYLMETCQRFETERERIEKWLPIGISAYETDDDGILDEIETESKPEMTARKSYSGEIVKKIIISSKSPPISRRSIKSSPEMKIEASDSLIKQIDSVLNMETFWFVYNKAEVELNELKNERKFLQTENKQLKENVKTLLEATVQNEKSKRSQHSGPQRRQLKTAIF